MTGTRKASSGVVPPRARAQSPSCRWWTGLIGSVRNSTFSPRDATLGAVDCGPSEKVERRRSGRNSGGRRVGPLHIFFTFSVDAPGSGGSSRVMEGHRRKF